MGHEELVHQTWNINPTDYGRTRDFWRAPQGTSSERRM